VTRTIGPLVGPEAGAPERIGFGDTATTVFEALVVVIAIVLVAGVARPSRPRPLRLAGAASLVTVVLVPQLALALKSAIASAPFIEHAG
jgi:hypothetical protein